MRVGIDLSKNVFVVYGVDERDRCVAKRTLERAKVLSFFAQQEPSLIGMEAGSGAHHWARELIKLGHDLLTNE
jgi:transposase